MLQILFYINFCIYKNKITTPPSCVPLDEVEGIIFALEIILNVLKNDLIIITF